MLIYAKLAELARARGQLTMSVFSCSSVAAQRNSVHEVRDFVFGVPFPEKPGPEKKKGEKRKNDQRN